MEFSRLEYWSGQPFPSSGDLPKPGIEPRSPALQAESWPVEPQGKPMAGPHLRNPFIIYGAMSLYATVTYFCWWSSFAMWPKLPMMGLYVSCWHFLYMWERVSAHRTRPFWSFLVPSMGNHFSRMASLESIHPSKKLYHGVSRGFPDGSAVKNLPGTQETQETEVWFLGQEDPQEEKVVTHSSILPWEIPWMEEPAWQVTVHRVAKSWRRLSDWAHGV